MTRLLSIQEAADVLGYTVKGLRKIVERSRAKACGARTRGPTIKFLQTCRGAPVKIDEELIKEFKERYMVDPDQGISAGNGRNGKKQPVSEIEAELLNL